MICPVEIADDMSALRAVRMRDHAEHGSLSEGRDGAGDESTGRDVASDGEEDHVVAGGGDLGHQRPAHAAVAGALCGRGVQRVAGPAARQAVAAPGTDGDGGESVRVVPGKVFRSERAAFSREARSRTRDRAELHLGEAGVAGSGPGGTREKARSASQAARAAAVAGDAVAYRRQPPPWFQDERWYDLIVILDDATSEIYYAQLVEEESTATVMAGLREVIERKGVFCALYSDRGSHFWLTPKVGGKVDYHRRTQVGRALHELGVQMIPAYSPEARGRSERNFSTWQGRLPQELRLRQVRTLEAANRFLREEYIAEFNRRFQVASRQRGNAFVPCRSRDLERIFSLQFERSVNRDNTVSFQNLSLQIERVRWRATLAGCQVVVHQHLDGNLSLTHGPHCLGRYDGTGTPLPAKASTETSRGRGTAPFPCNPIPKTNPTQLARAHF